MADIDFAQLERVQWSDGTSRYPTRTGFLLAGRVADLDPEQLVDVRDDELDDVVQVRAKLLEVLR